MKVLVLYFNIPILKKTANVLAKYFDADMEMMDIVKRHIRDKDGLLLLRPINSNIDKYDKVILVTNENNKYTIKNIDFIKSRNIKVVVVYTDKIDKKYKDVYYLKDGDAIEFNKIGEL